MINIIITIRTIHGAIYWQYTRLILDIYFNAWYHLIHISSYYTFFIVKLTAKGKIATNFECSPHLASASIDCVKKKKVLGKCSSYLTTLPVCIVVLSKITLHVILDILYTHSIALLLWGPGFDPELELLSVIQMFLPPVCMGFFWVLWHHSIIQKHGGRWTGYTKHCLLLWWCSVNSALW